MKGFSNRNICICLCLVVVLMPQAVFANSSWHWVSDYRPWDILPWVAAATIIIEVLAIWQIPKTKQLLKTAVTVVIANLVSFLLPYGILAAADVVHDTFQGALNAGPSYIVGVMFLLLTLVAELPIVYDILKPHVEKSKVLLWTIVFSNAATTAMVAIVERIITEGSW